MADIFTRSKLNPILRPGKDWWKIYNPAAILGYDGTTHLFPRVMSGISALAKLGGEELKAFYKKARDEHVFPQVTFCPGIVLNDGMLWLYYGAGDTSICTAWAPLADILKLIPSLQ